jgi:pyruvate kinase
MLSIQTPQDLLAKVQTLRGDVLSNCEEIASTWRPLIERAAFHDSAVNLASYLALRRHDLRDLQVALMRWGLSSLGRSESRVQPSLNAVIATLGAICHAAPETLTPYPSEEEFFQGSRIIASEADLIFG